jgi:hypothetical protein
VEESGLGKLTSPCADLLGLSGSAAVLGAVTCWLGAILWSSWASLRWSLRLLGVVLSPKLNLFVEARTLPDPTPDLHTALSQLGDKLRQSIECWRQVCEPTIRHFRGAGPKHRPYLVQSKGWLSPYCCWDGREGHWKSLSAVIPVVNRTPVAWLKCHSPIRS